MKYRITLALVIRIHSVISTKTIHSLIISSPFNTRVPTHHGRSCEITNA